MDALYLAVDLGSTTIDVALIDDNKILTEKSIKNRQSLYGSDVLNRIMNSVRNPDNQIKMKDFVLSDITEIMKELIDNSNKDISCLKRIIISGNTTMISIILGYDLEPLGHAPFDRQLVKSVCDKAGKYIRGVSDNCQIIFTGCASAFIGGDILSGLLFIEREYMLSSDSNYMLIDLGTNGEIVLHCNNSMYATSTACGPAFEGCTRKQSVYGSNTIDAICMAIKAGKLSREGVLADEFFDSELNICGVHLTMEILRQILMAKAAIYSGIISILEYAGVNAQELDYVFLAGGFGNYLNIDNAIFIGLLPGEFKKIIKPVGNTSLKGSILMVRDDTLVEYLDTFTEDKIKILQLADYEEYKNSLIENMHF